MYVLETFILFLRVKCVCESIPAQLCILKLERRACYCNDCVLPRCLNISLVLLSTPANEKMQQLPAEEDGMGTDEFLPHFQTAETSQIISKLKHAILFLTRLSACNCLQFPMLILLRFLAWYSNWNLILRAFAPNFLQQFNATNVFARFDAQEHSETNMLKTVTPKSL